MKVHVAATGHILDPNTFRLGDGVEARRRYALTQKIAIVRGKQRARIVVEGTLLPLHAATRAIRVALGLSYAGSMSTRIVATEFHFLLSVCARLAIDRTPMH